MVKYSVFPITSILMLLFVAGCSQNTSPPSARSRHADVKAEKTGPIAVESVKDKTQTDSAEAKIKETDTHSKIPFYNEYANFLAEYVDNNGMVDYGKLKHRRSDLKLLLEGLADFSAKTYKSMSKEDKIAFWINAYNIQMLNIIVKNYPIESTRIRRVFWPPTSIRHISGIWDQNKFIIMDEEFTLNEIDQRFFQTEFDVPRAFLAITHASLSSPPLRNKPYDGTKLYQQLDDQVGKFLSSPRAFEIKREKNQVVLSAIFQESWHGKYFTKKYITDKKFKTFEPTQRAILNFVSNYIPGKDVSYLELENYTIEYIKYDWRLNDSSANY